jgi:hypothetical protein
MDENGKQEMRGGEMELMDSIPWEDKQRTFLPEARRYWKINIPVPLTTR